MSTTEQEQKQSQDKMRQDPSAAREFDPVCGMPVDDIDPNLTVRRDGTDYQFCSASCREKFRASPEMFI